MAEKVKNMDLEAVFRTPIIVYANHFRFGAGEVVGPRVVASRMILWTIGGRGRIEVNGTRFELEAGSTFALPWNHIIKYTSSRDQPLHVGGVHVIPALESDVSIEWRAAHGSEDPLKDSTMRQNVSWAGLDRAVQFFGSGAEEVRSLCEIAVNRYTDGPTVEVMRSLAIALIASILASTGRSGEPGLPPGLRAAQEYCAAHLNFPITTRDLAAAAGMSESGLVRQFRLHSNSSPQRWLRDLRLERAARLLRTSTLRINQVSRAVGYPDPLHFSRAFSVKFGVGPRQYARSFPKL